MHGGMAGFYEARVDGPGRRHCRAFFVLEHHGMALGLGGAASSSITGMVKEFRTTFSARDYEKIRQLRAEYRSRRPRSVAR